MMSTNKISVALVDDSSVIRGALARILESDPEIDVVASVSNGQMGVSIAKTKQPNILILDVEMPVMDGLTALPEILKNSPNTKVVMCSSLTAKGADTTLKAFSAGAVECIVKPSSAEATGADSPFRRTLLDIVKNLGRDSAGSSTTSTATTTSTASIQTKPVEKPRNEFTLRQDSMAYRGKPKIIAIGSSTGGPQALFSAISGIGSVDVPIVITQHMPATFTKTLANHITANTGITTHEGEDGMPVVAGEAYVAPGGKHMLFNEVDGQLRIKIDDGPAENFCKPAVDPMLRSLMEIYNEKFVCIILTGMGQDGLLGARALTERHGRVIAQDEETSVIWGMPGAVAMDGICEAVLPIDEIGSWVRNALFLRN